jgi:hypothetical protein
MVLPAATPMPTEDPNERVATVAVLPGEKVMVSGTLDRVLASQPDAYRDPAKTFRLRPSAIGSMVLTPARAAQGLYRRPSEDSSKVGVAFGGFGLVVMLLTLVHLFLFQLAGPVVIGNVTGYHDETGKNHQTFTLAEITYLDSSGAPHRLDRGYGYFAETPRIGMNVRVQYFPGVPSDSELKFEGFNLGLIDSLGFLLAVVPLFVGLGIGLSKPRIGEPRELRVPD